jgi:hypothetical protein
VAGCFATVEGDRGEEDQVAQSERGLVYVLLLRIFEAAMGQLLRLEAGGGGDCATIDGTTLLFSILWRQHEPIPVADIIEVVVVFFTVF